MKFLLMILGMIASAYGGVLPLASYAAVAPVASSYSAHTINHAIATPAVAAAPLVAAPAPLVAAPAPLIAAPAPLAAAVSPYAAISPYAAYPYASAYLG